MKPTEKLINVVLERNAMLEDRQEKLAALIIQDHKDLEAMVAAIPGMKEAALAEVQKQIAEKCAAIEKSLAELNAAGFEEITGQANAKIAEALSVAVKDVEAARAQLSAERNRVITMADFEPRLVEFAERAAKKGTLAQLTAKDGQALIAETFKRLVQPVVAELAAKDSFIDLYQGTFKAGVSQAKRGELWTYYGSLFLCLADTDSSPKHSTQSGQAVVWKLVVAAGTSVVSTTTSGGSFSWSSVPASASDTGTAGDLAYDESYVYICTATNTWTRAALNSW